MNAVPTIRSYDSRERSFTGGIPSADADRALEPKPMYEQLVIRPERAVATVAENRAYSVPRHFEARDFDISVMREAQAIRAVGGLKLPSRYQSLLLIAGDDRSIDLA